MSRPLADRLSGEDRAGDAVWGGAELERERGRNETAWWLASPPLLDRDGELALIDEALESAAGGSGCFLIVEGQPGIGKSRLLEAAQAIAAAADVDVLTARGSDLEKDFPFDVALQLFEPRVRGASEEDRAVLLSGAGALARPLFEPEAPAPQDLQRGSFLHGLYWLASNLAERSTVMLTIDDAHWADRQTLEFLLYLLQRVDELSLFVVITLRSREAHSHRALIDKLLGHPLARVIRLSPLSDEAAVSFVRETLPGADHAFGAACASATGGNPLLLRELSASLKAKGIEPTAAAIEVIPELDYETVSQWILLRLSHLEPNATRLAAAVSVLGPGARLSQSAALAGLEMKSAVVALDHLEEADILRGGDQLEFVHPIVRWSVYATLSRADRVRMHRAAAERFHQEGAAVDRIATHLRSTPVVAEPWALEVLRRAAAEARTRGAQEVAASYLRRALEEPMDRETRAKVLVLLGTAEATVGEPRALERLTHALELVSDPEAKAEIFHGLGRTLYTRGDLANAGLAFRRGLTALEDGSRRSRLRAQLEADLLTIGLFDLGSRDTTAPEIRVVLEKPLSQPLPDEPSLLATLALARSFAGSSHSEVRRLVAKATANGLLSGDPLDPSVFAAARALGAADDIEQERRVLNAALDDARRRGSVMAFATASYLRSWPNYFGGHLADAVADVQHAFDSIRYGWKMYLPAATAFLCHTLIERGEFAAATEAIGTVDEERWQSTSLWAYVLDARGRLLLLEDKPEQALEDLLECGRLLLEEALAPNPAIIPWRSRAALAAARLGDKEQGRSLASEEVELARRFGAPRPIGMALRALGEMEDRDAAIDLLRESTAVLEGSPSQLEYARSLIYLGGALRRAGDVHGSRAQLEEGLRLANDMGARALSKRARKELLGVGVVPKHQLPTGLRTLTPSQQRIVQMAAQGMTNREIAEALFVTIKAVEWHLTRAYSRLGISSRRELTELIKSQKD